jgi:CarboxypepD_reg-like domain/TonB-dependent Receptor Plug Domain
MLKHFFTIALLTLGLTATAQTKATISGSVRDAKSGEELIGAAIRLVEKPTVGALANDYGFYSLTTETGKYQLLCTYIGYQDMILPVDLTIDQKVDFQLLEDGLLEAVEVTSTRNDDHITNTSIGTERMEMKTLAKLPVIFGERDPLKSISLLPGVKSAGEGNSGFFVRGGAADQNLIILDEAPVYNASHLLGFFSTFNSDAIKNVTLIKGNSPVQYGGRLSSVLDVRMNEGNDKTYHVAGGIGLISSRVSVEGPIQKEKSSFLVTARRTYADAFLKLSPDFSDNKLYFYDFNAKANYRINDKNRVFLSGYFGRDVLGFGEQFGIDWGNQTGTLRWNSVLNPKLFSNTSLIYSDYDYKIKISPGDDSEFNITSKIRDLNFKQEFQFFPSEKSNWRFGVNSIYHTVRPSKFAETGSGLDSLNRYAWENAIYAGNTYKASSKWNLDYGIRLSSYTVIGGENAYQTYERGIATDTVDLGDGALGKTYTFIEPRFAASYRLSTLASIKAGIGRNTQNLHLLSNSATGNPTDQWIGSSYSTKPEIADQISLGYFRIINDGNYEFSAETYFKYMQNQVDYKNGADINNALDVESELLYGDGRAYGLELLLKKNKGKFTGWLGYTLSRSERLIDGINNNEWYVAKQDRTHDLSLVGMYELNKKWSFSASFVYNTGNAITFPSGKYNVAGNTVLYYGERNGYRMPDYHRLDLSATYERKRKKNRESSWNFGLYNAYGRENAYSITFEDDPDDANRTRTVQTALFKWVPSVTYNFRF